MGGLNIRVWGPEEVRHGDLTWGPNVHVWGPEEVRHGGSQYTCVGARGGPTGGVSIYVCGGQRRSDVGGLNIRMWECWVKLRSTKFLRGNFFY